jgi:hypothetical protein
MKHRLQPADKSFIKRLKAYYGIDSVSGWYEANQAKFLNIKKKHGQKQQQSILLTEVFDQRTCLP